MKADLLKNAINWCFTIFFIALISLVYYFVSPRIAIIILVFILFNRIGNIQNSMYEVEDDLKEMQLKLETIKRYRRNI